MRETFTVGMSEAVLVAACVVVSVVRADDVGRSELFVFGAVSEVVVGKAADELVPSVTVDVVGGYDVIGAVGLAGNEV